MWIFWSGGNAILLISQIKKKWFGSFWLYHAPRQVRRQVKVYCCFCLIDFEITHVITLNLLFVGPERLFSAAGRMHDDFRKSTLEESLKHCLIIYQNM